MTDQEIDIAIAEVCEYERRECRPGEFRMLKEHPQQGVGGAFLPMIEAPRYCNDLNAMHEAEKHLPGMKELEYLQQLGKRDLYCSWGSVCATARQRAEAFLRTLGKWKEAGND